MAEARVKESQRLDVRIKEIYKNLEGLTFKAVFDGFVTMRQFYLPVPRKRPVYLVRDTSTHNVLEEIYRDTKALEKEYGREIWKGITTSGDKYKLWGTEDSTGYNVSNVYYIPSDGVEVIANRTVDFLAVVNITVEEGQKQLLVCPLYYLSVLQKFM